MKNLQDSINTGMKKWVEILQTEAYNDSSTKYYKLRDIITQVRYIDFWQTVELTSLN